jgi:K+-transporting ATPase ATPase C chain
MVMMFKETANQLKTACILLLSLTVLTGLLYPLTITALAQLFFPKMANGSLVEKDGELIGSVLIGQAFSSPHYFWGRPSDTKPYPYNGQASSGSNNGPLNSAFLASVQERINNLKQYNVFKDKLIPVDLVTSSASGLDPDISPAAAFYQVSRIAKERHIPEKNIQDLIIYQTKRRVWDLLGEPRVNVLQLNLALDDLGVSK